MKTCYDRFALYKYNLDTYIMPHTVIKSRYTNVKNHSEISRYFSVHVLPYPLRNSKELAKFYHFKLPWRLPGQRPIMGKHHILTNVHAPEQVLRVMGFAHLKTVLIDVPLR